MNGKVKMVCRGIISAGVLMLLASLVYYLTRWNDLPDNPGIHFDGNGNFDVYASKFYGFYPHVIGGLIAAILAAAVHLEGKVNVGLKITEKGDRLFRAEVGVTMSLISLIVSAFFTNWSLSVSRQTPLNRSVLSIICYGIMIVLLSGLTAQVITCKKYSVKEKKENDPLLKRRLSSIIMWLMTAASIFVLLVTWSRHPSVTDEQFYYEHFGYAWFEQPGIFVHRNYLLIPHALMIIYSAVMEVLTVRIVKKNGKPLLDMISDLKTISAFMIFALLINIDSDIIPGLEFFLICAAFICVILVKFAIARRKEKAVE